jgi:TolB-like protein/thioredoxin-like negative regulator of GroEL
MPIALGPTQTNTVAQATLDTNRVVVLPFKVIGGAQDSADLGYGLVSTLTSKLQPLQNLVVIANESARKFKDSDQSPNEIGQALQVGTIVTGEIQTDGSKVQVNIRVIDANTEALGWGSTFTKTKEDFLDLQNEIATKLASELKGGLATGEAQQLAQKATENAEAQAEYQAGRREWNKRSKEGFDKAIKHFEKAIELDPDYADPYAGMADTYSLLPTYNFAEPSEAIIKVKFYSGQAIEKNPKLAEAYTSLAWVLHNFEYDWKQAEENFRKAIEINPNYATGYQWFAIFLSHRGEQKESIAMAVKATQLDPQSMIIKHSAAQLNLLAEQNDQALQYLNESLAIDPYFAYSLWLKHAKINERNLIEDINHLKEAIRKYPNQPMHRKTLAEMYWKTGDKEAAMEQMMVLLDQYHDSFNKSHFADLYFVMGKPDHAYRWLEKAFKAKEGHVLFYGNLPTLKKYQSQPRFRELYKKINHPLYVD